MENYSGNSTTGADGGQDIPDDGDNWCMTCRGKGGSIERQDPVGDGVGYETFLNVCPDCLGSGRCPWCGCEVDKEYNCANATCLWTPDQIDAAGSFDDDDWYDYFDELPL